MNERERLEKELKILERLDELEKIDKVEIERFVRAKETKENIEHDNCKKKVCSKCKAVLTLDKFNKKYDNLDGLQSWCRDCHRLINKNHRKKDETRSNKDLEFDFEMAPTGKIYCKAVKKLITKGMKPCRSCKKILPLNKFNTDTNSFGYKTMCKKCYVLYYKRKYDPIKAHEYYAGLKQKRDGIVPLSELVEREKKILSEQTEKPDHEISDGTKTDAIPVTNIPESIDEKNIDSVINDPEKRKKFFLFRSKEL